MLDTCAICGSKHIEMVRHTKETIIKGKTLIIENIPLSEKCISCGEVYYGPEAMEYIENQIEKLKDE